MPCHLGAGWEHVGLTAIFHRQGTSFHEFNASVIAWWFRLERQDKTLKQRPNQRKKQQDLDEEQELGSL